MTHLPDSPQEPETNVEAVRNRVQAFLLVPFNRIRVWLMLSGLLLILIYGLRLPAARNLVKEEIREKHFDLAQAQVDAAIHFEQGRAVVALVLGVVIIVVGTTLKNSPLKITVLCFVLYLVFQGVFLALKPADMLAGMLMKLLIAATLAKAIHSAYGWVRTSDTPA